MNTPVNFGSAPDLSDCQFSVGGNILGGLDPLDSEALAANFGADVLVNLVVGADTPIENVS